jgi:hypothetical protein
MMKLKRYVTRRQVRGVLLAVLFVFAGSGLAASTPPPPVNDEPGPASFTVHIENNDDTAHTISIVISHQITPLCRYSQPQCDAPTVSETIVKEEYKLAAGEQITISNIHTFVPPTLDIDTYTVTLRTDDGDSASVTGIAKLDSRFLWNSNSEYYREDFFVSNGDTDEFQGKIATDGSVTLAVEPLLLRTN